MTAPPTDLLDTPHLDALWVAVRRGDEQAATDVVLAALDDGADPETVLLDVVGAVQCRVGSEWAANRLSVAEEHTATAINERVVSAVHRWLPRTEPTLGHIVVACVDGEWHALPARLLAEVLRLRGFRVEYLGAQLPAPHLVAHLHRAGRRGDLGVDRHPPSDRARHHHRLPRDGRSDHRRWCRLRVGRSLRPVARSRSVGARRPRGRRPAEARAAAPAREQHPGGRRPAPSRGPGVHDGLEDDAAALYVGDPDLFRRFLAWTVEILQARRVPAHLVATGLEALAGELRDFPRASAMLGDALVTLRNGDES